ncbi:MAG: cytochrome P450 [Acidimicrobiia bacterium]
MITDDLGIDVDLSAQQFGRAIPWETLRVLRQKAPLHWHEATQGWIVTTHELLGQINRDPQRFSSWAGPSPAEATSENLANKSGLTILTMDPPRHGIYRRLVNSDFNPRAVSLQEDRIRAMAHELVDEFVAAGGGDFVTAIASALPMRAIASLMGIAREDEPMLIRLANAIVGGSDPEYYPGSPEAMAEAARQYSDFADRLLDEHRANPRGDLVDRLLDARVDGVPLSQLELQAWVTMYISGGAETTRHLIANGLLALFEWPDAAAALRDGADMRLAVEEMLRYTTPVMNHARWPTEDVEIMGHTIGKGQRTTLWMLSANRDESVFEDADRFDITRDPNKHDSFGAGGPHFCIGAGYARLETIAVFDALLPYLDRLEPAGPPERAQNSMFNSIKHLPVRVRP